MFPRDLKSESTPAKGVAVGREGEHCRQGRACAKALRQEKTTLRGRQGQIHLFLIL